MPSYHKVHSREYETLENSPATQPLPRIIPVQAERNQVGHFHGDSLSSLLFCIALAHLSLMLNDSTDGFMSQYGKPRIISSIWMIWKPSRRMMASSRVSSTSWRHSAVTLRWNLVLKSVQRPPSIDGDLPVLAIFILANSTTMKELEEERTYKYVEVNEGDGIQLRTKQWKRRYERSTTDKLGWY